MLMPDALLYVHTNYGSDAARNLTGGRVSSAVRNNLFFAPSTPTTYTLELTSRCNQFCLGCGNHNVFDRQALYLSGDEWIALLDKIRPYARYVRLTGGECILHPDFRSIVCHLDTFDIPFAIFTNGLWSKPDMLVAFLAERQNLSALLVSLHGPDAETHRAFAGSHSFDIILTNIRRAIVVGLVVDTNTVFTRRNWQKVEAIVHLSASLGARGAVFSRYYGVGLPMVDLSDQDLAEAIRSVESLRTAGWSSRLNPCVPKCFTPSSSDGCGAGITLCTVDPTGNVRPCNHAALLMGNLTRMDMPTIWASSEATHWRSLVPESCMACSALVRCRGGCRAIALHRGLTADPLICEPIPGSTQSPRRIFAGLHPVPCFTTRSQDQERLLICLSRVVPVTKHGLQVANALDGQATLADLSCRFGEQAIEFILDLYEQGMVHLE